MADDAPIIEKRKVTMTNVSAQIRDDGTIQNMIHKAEDYVPLDLLESYVADAHRTWQSVIVDHEAGHDPGPGGDEGDTFYPDHLDHPLAGTMLPGGQS